MREFTNVCAGAAKTMLDGEWMIGILIAGDSGVAADAVKAIVGVGSGRIQASLGAAARQVA